MKQEDKEHYYKIGGELLAEQNFQKAILAGSIAAILAATFWGVLAASTGFVVSYMAIGVGVFIGFTVQLGGRGIDNKFAVLASALAVASCVSGNVAAALIYEAQVYQIPVSQILSEIDVELVIDFLREDLQFTDIIFWILAMGAAVYFSKRPLTREQGLAIYTLRRRSEQGGIVT